MEWIVLMMLLGTAATAYGQYQQGKMQQRWAEYNAAVSKQEVALEKQRMRKERVKLLSAQRVGYAKAGVQLTGTPLEVMAETAKEIEHSMILREHRAAIETGLWGYKGRAARQAGAWAAGTTLLTGGAQAAAMQYRMTHF